MPANPSVTFGIIVLNGEPFTRYCLRALYPFAHQIIVVEGAVPSAKGIATAQGHSTDSTLDSVRAFIGEEDTERKVILVTAEDEGHPDGFWPGEKDEMSAAYAKRATGEWLWQVDIDEFYAPADMERVFRRLKESPTVGGATFKTLTFWGGFDYVVDGWYLRRGAAYYERLFRWGKGYRYLTHRPPTVVDETGRDVKARGWITGNELEAEGIVLYHYSLLLPKQVTEKCRYYAAAPWAQREGAERWARESFLELRRPYRVHNVYQHPSWLSRFEGRHPPEIERMRRDLEAGRGGAALRPTSDIESLLASPSYALGRLGLKGLDYADRLRRKFMRRFAPAPAGRSGASS